MYHGGEGSHTGKGQTPGVSSSVSSGISQNETALSNLVGQETQQSQQLFNLAAPGFAQAEDYYQSLASGNPAAITRAIAPTAQASAQAQQGANANIMANDPAGGEKNLALEQSNIARQQQIAGAASGASTAANQSLGQLAGQGIGESQTASGQASQGLSAGISGYGTLGNLQLSGQQLQMEQKGQQLGVMGGLVGDVGSVAGSQQGGKSALDALAALG